MSYGDAELQAQRAAWKGMMQWLSANKKTAAVMSIGAMPKDDALALMDAIFTAYHNSLQAAASPY